MNKQKDFLEKVAGRSPIAADLFWGTFAIMIFVIAEILYELIGWPGWFILATITNCIVLVIESLRFRAPLLSKYRSARKTSLFIIFVFIVLCIITFIKIIFTLK